MIVLMLIVVLVLELIVILALFAMIVAITLVVVWFSLHMKKYSSPYIHSFFSYMICVLPPSFISYVMGLQNMRRTSTAREFKNSYLGGNAARNRSSGPVDSGMGLRYVDHFHLSEKDARM